VSGVRTLCADTHLVNPLSGIASGFGLSGWMQSFDRSMSQVVSGSDLVNGMVGTMVAAAGVQASISVLHSADEMLGTLLDALA
jgi:hypothetical protein